jgi:polysaccharide biosynthesis/export protein
MHIKFSKFTAWLVLGRAQSVVSLAFVLVCMLCYQPAIAQGTALMVPAAVAALPQTQAESIASIANYKITSSDLLEIEVFGVEDLKRTVRVNTSGSISIPLVGMVQVAGLTATEAEVVIAMRYAADYLQNPQVSVFIKEFTTQRVTIDGAVNKPGIYPLTGQITLLRALALAGGGGQLANMEDVLLFRSNGAEPQQVFKYDVRKIRNGELEDPMLKGDDLVVVNRSGARELLKDSVLRDVLDFINPFSILSK